MNLAHGSSGLFSSPHLKRLTQILRVAASYGWSQYVERLGLAHYLSVKDREQRAATNTDGVRLRAAFEELGPTFVKFGQLLSVQRDLLPDEVVHELQHLQERVPPFSGDEAVRIVEQELGAPVEILFQHFERVPFAAASIAQVHCATSRDGARLVVKVQRPGIGQVINEDVAVLSLSPVNWTAMFPPGNGLT